MMDKNTRQQHQSINPNLIVNDLVCFVCKAWSRPHIAAEVARELGVSYTEIQDWKEEIPEKYRPVVLRIAQRRGIDLTLFERFYLNTGLLDGAKEVATGWHGDVKAER